MLAELKRLLPGFSIYENSEKIDIYQPYDVELRVTIKKKTDSYYLFALHRGDTMFFTSVINSNEAIVCAYFLVGKYLSCDPKPHTKRIRKNILFYHKELSKKMKCPPSIETVQDLYMQIWELP